jgi:superkiller protein 3
MAARMNDENARDLDWWRITWWVPAFPRVIITGLPAAALAAFFALQYHVVLFHTGYLARIMIAVAAGLSVLLWFGRKAGTGGDPPKNRPPVRWRKLARPSTLASIVGYALAGALIFWLLYQLGIASYGLAGGAVIGITFGLSDALSSVFSARPAFDRVEPLSPLRSWRADNIHALTHGLPGALLIGAAWVLLDWRAFQAQPQIGIGVLAVLLALWLMGDVMFSSTCWPAMLAFAQLAARRRTPVRLMQFLEDACARNVLRAVGNSYQFRHARLQDLLADQWHGIRLRPSPGSQRHTAQPVGLARGLEANAPLVSGRASQLADDGDSLYDQHRYAEAETAYRNAVTADPQLARAHMGIGRTLNRLHRYHEAESACREAIRLDPSSAHAHASLGAALNGLDRYQEAEKACTEAIRLDSGLASAYNNLGVVLVNMHRYPQAETALREAIHLDSGLASSWRNLGIVLLRTHRYPQAETALREAIRLDSGDALNHANLGSTLYKMNRYAETEATCREAIRLDPALARAHFTLSWVLCDLVRNQEADATYEEAVRLNPAYGKRRYKIGRAVVKVASRGRGKQMSRAKALQANLVRKGTEAACREAIRLDPGNALKHNDLGLILFEVERYGEATAAFRRAIELDPGDAVIRLSLARSLRNDGLYAEAETAYREAIRLDPNNAHAYNELGITLFRMRRHRDAEAAYQEAVRLAPEDTRMRANLRKAQQAQVR